MEGRGVESDVDWAPILGPLREMDERVAASRWPAMTRAVFDYAPRGLRLRPECSPDDLPFDTIPVDWFPRARWLADGSIRPGGFLQHAAADYYVQDPGSTLAVALCQIEPGQSVFDACAAPGGKSTAILEQLAGAGVLLANEVIHSRVKTLETALQRSGFANWCVMSADLERLPPVLHQRWDCVLVDAPCSGQSLVGKGRQSMSAFAARQVEHCALRQMRILEAAAGLVRPGGRLVYSTCTFSYAENEEMVGRFVESHPGWEPIRLPELERWEVPGHSGCYRVWPHLDPAAGGFAAALRCPSPADCWADRAVARSPLEKAPRTSRMRRGSRSAPGIGVLANPPAVPWGAWKDGDWLWFQRGDTLMVAPRASAEWETLRFSAISVARKRGPDWQPSYGCGRAAQSLLDSYPMLELATDQAVSYVRGDSIPVSSRAAGWYIVHWQGRRLGWAKAAGGRLRNHFPKGLRQECPR